MPYPPLSTLGSPQPQPPRPTVPSYDQYDLSGLPSATGQAASPDPSYDQYDLSGMPSLSNAGPPPGSPAPIPMHERGGYLSALATQAGAQPDPVTGRWPSDFKAPGHPNEFAGGFSTRTRERMPSMPRGDYQDLLDVGWTPEAAAELSAAPDPARPAAPMVAQGVTGPGTLRVYEPGQPVPPTPVTGPAATWKPTHQAMDDLATRRPKTIPFNPPRFVEPKMAAGHRVGGVSPLKPSPTPFDTPPPVVPGNIDLYNRPTVPNAIEGGTSTVWSASARDDDGLEVLIPKVVNNRAVEWPVAWAHYKKTGEHLGKFKTPEEATAYAIKLHNDYASGRYRTPGVTEPLPSHERELTPEQKLAASFAKGQAQEQAPLGLADFIAGLSEPTPGAESQDVPFLHPDIALPARSISKKGVEKLPFVGSLPTAVDAYNVIRAARRVRDGQGTEADQQVLNDFVAKDEEAQKRGTSFLYKVADVASSIPAFAVEFGATGGVFNGVKKLVTEALAKRMATSGAKAAAEFAAERAVRAGLGYTAGAAAQTLLMPQRIAAEALRRQQPTVEQARVGAKALEDWNDDFVPALAKAIPNEFVQVFSERTGGLVEGIPGKLAALPVATRVRALKEAVLSRWLKTHPDKGIGEFFDLVKSKTAWNGILGEMFEERVAEVMTAAQPYLREPGQEQPALIRTMTGEGGREKAVSDLWQQMAVEAVAFAVPGAARSLVDASSRQRPGPAPAPPGLSEAPAPMVGQERHAAPYPQYDVSERPSAKAATTSAPEETVIAARGSAIAEPAPPPPDTSPAVTPPASAPPGPPAVEPPTATAGLLPPDAIPDKSIVESRHETREPDVVQAGPQAQPRIDREGAQDAEEAVRIRRTQAVNAWLEALARGEAPDRADAAYQSTRVAGAPEMREPGVREGADTGRVSVRTSASNVGVPGTTTPDVGTRPPQKRRQPGQPPSEPGTVQRERSPQEARAGNIAGRTAQDLDVGRGEGEIGSRSVEQEVRALRGLPNRGEAAHRARALSQLLHDAPPGSPEETAIIAAVEREATDESLRQSFSVALHAREAPEDRGGVGQEVRPAGEAPAARQAEGAAEEAVAPAPFQPPTTRESELQAYGDRLDAIVAPLTEATATFPAKAGAETTAKTMHAPAAPLSLQAHAADLLSRATDAGRTERDLAPLPATSRDKALAAIQAPNTSYVVTAVEPVKKHPGVWKISVQTGSGARAVQYLRVPSAPVGTAVESAEGRTSDGSTLPARAEEPAAAEAGGAVHREVISGVEGHEGRPARASQHDADAHPDHVAVAEGLTGHEGFRTLGLTPRATARGITFDEPTSGQSYVGTVEDPSVFPRVEDYESLASLVADLQRIGTTSYEVDGEAYALPASRADYDALPPAHLAALADLGMVGGMVDVAAGTFQINREMLGDLTVWLEELAHIGYGRMTPEAKAERGITDTLSEEQRVREGDLPPPSAYTRQIGDDGDGTRFSVRRWEKEGKARFVEEARKLGTPETTITQAVELVDASVKVFKGRPDIFPQEGGRDKFGQLLDAFMPNRDFKFTLDINRTCQRILKYWANLSAIERRWGKPLTPDQMLRLGQEMRRAGDIPGCIYCYVEAARRATRRNAFRFATWTKRDATAFARERGGTKEPALVAKIAERDGLLRRAKMSLSDFARYVTQPGHIEQAIREGGPLGMAVRMYNRYAASGGGAALTGYAAYRQELLDRTEDEVAESNRRAGMRLQSATDLDPTQIVDRNEFFADATIKRQAAHEYTKEPYDVLIYGRAGVKQNMSIAMDWDASAKKFVDDKVNGMPWNVSMPLREEYENAGTMLMIKNMAQLRWALQRYADQRAGRPLDQSGPKYVDMGIPHHAAYWDGGVDRFGIFDLDDFSRVQHEHWIDKDRAKAEHGNDDPDEAFGEKLLLNYWLKQKNNDEDAAVQAYLAFCRRNNLAPKWSAGTYTDHTTGESASFPDMTGHPGYAMLLKDYARTDTPQVPLNVAGTNRERMLEFLQRFVRRGGWTRPTTANPATVESFLKLLRSGKDLEIKATEDALVLLHPRVRNIDTPRSLRLTTSSAAASASATGAAATDGRVTLNQTQSARKFAVRAKAKAPRPVDTVVNAIGWQRASELFDNMGLDWELGDNGKLYERGVSDSSRSTGRGGPRYPVSDAQVREALSSPTLEVDAEIADALQEARTALGIGAEKTASKQTETPAFKAWFGDSKVVDENGNPLVVYHGTADDITSFDLDHPNRKDTGWLGTGVYVTTSAPLAGSYATLKRGEAGENVLPLYAKLERPYYATQDEKQRIQLISHNQGKEAGRAAADAWTRELQVKGHDGVILRYDAKTVGEKNVSDEMVVFDPTGVKSAIGNRGTFDPENPDIRYAVRVKSARTGEEVFGYDYVGDAVRSWPQSKGTADQLRAHLAKTKGAMEEAEEIGLREWLKDKVTVTKAAAEEYVQTHEITLTETVLGSNRYDFDPSPELDVIERAGYEVQADDPESEPYLEKDGRPIEDYVQAGVPPDIIDAFTSMMAREAAERAPEYESYQAIPGGTNPREILLNLPANTRPMDTSKMVARLEEETADGKYWNVFFRQNGSLLGSVETRVVAGADEALRTYASQHTVREPERNYIAPHFSSSNNKNLLLHTRVWDYELPGGKKILVAKEVQSDWHQAGRREGYARDTKGWTAHRLNEPDAGFNHWQINDAAGNYVTKIVGGTEESAIRKASEGVPSAPFKDAGWKKLALRRLIAYAQQHGYDGLGWTTGEQQADLYNLAKHIDSLQLVDDAGALYLTAFKGSHPVIDSRRVNENVLPEIVGKELAQRLLAAEPTGGNGRTSRHLRGVDLTVGGTGMVGFYDRELVNLANDLAKPLKTKVQQIAVPTEDVPGQPTGLAKVGIHEQPVPKGVEANHNGWSIVMDDGTKWGIWSKKGDAQAALERLKADPLALSSPRTIWYLPLKPTEPSKKYAVRAKKADESVVAYGRTKNDREFSKTFANEQEARGWAQENDAEIVSITKKSEMPAPDWETANKLMKALADKQYVYQRGTPKARKPPDVENDPDIKYAVRATPQKPPTKTVTAYKLFQTKPSAPGELFPLFIDKGTPVPIGRWIPAAYNPTKGYAERPGWHAGQLPMAPHLRSKVGRIQPGRVWAEVELPADVDWQTKADSTPTLDIRGKVPIGGHYRFKTSKMQGGAWLIGGAMRVVRVLSDEDVDTILEQAGEGAEAAAEHRGDLRYAVRARRPAAGEAPSPLAELSDEDLDDYFNFRRADISDEQKQHLRQEVRRVVNETGRNPKERITFEEIRNEALALHPDAVRLLKPFMEQQPAYRAVRDAARNRINVLNREIWQAQRDLAGLVGDELLAKTREIDQKEQDIKGLLDTWMRMRSEDGRNLAMHRMMSNDLANQFDATYWISKARRAMGLPPDADLPTDIAQKLRDILEEGRQAIEEDKKAAGEEEEEAAPSPPAQGPADAPTTPPAAPVQPPAGAPSATTPTTASPSAAPAPATPPATPPAGRMSQPRVSRTTGPPSAAPAGQQAPPAGTPAAPAARPPRPARPARPPSQRVQIAQLRLIRLVANLQKDGPLAVISAVRKAGLLTGPKTFFRNVAGNAAFQVLEETSRVPAALLDMALSLATGVRTVQGVSPRAIAAASYEAATDGVRQAGQVMRHGTSVTNRMMGVPHELNSGIPWLDAYVNTVFRFMGAQDRVFKSYAFRRSIEEQAKLLSINTGANPVQLLLQPTPAMLTRALADAEFATFNNQNPVSSFVTSGKAGLRRHGTIVGDAGSFLIDTAVPFVNTPSNIVARMLDYTPLGAMPRLTTAMARSMIQKSMTAEQQRAFSLAIGRGLIGSALIYLGWLLAKAGLATGTDPETPGKRAVNEAGGRLPGALLIGDRWRQIASFSPAGNIVTLGASLYRSANRSLASEAKRPAAVAATAAKIVLEQPMLKGASGFLDALQNPGSRGEAFTASIAGSFVPTLVNDLAGAFDPYRRDARPEGFTEAIWKGVNARLPGARTLLPKRLDVLGREQKQDLRVLWDPTIATVAKELSDPVIAALVRNDVGIGWPNRNADESKADYDARAAHVGQVIQQHLEVLVNRPKFLRADPDEQKEQLEDAISAARVKARPKKAKGQE